MIELYNEDCLNTMKRIPDGSIDLMLTDPPYGTTACEWDIAPNLTTLWKEWDRILKPNGICAIFCNEPFTADLIISNRGFFKYKWIWNKEDAGGYLNAYKMPLMGYEEICIFSRAKMGRHTYNAQITDKAKNLIRPLKKGSTEYIGTYGKHDSRKFKNEDNTKAFPRNIISIGRNEAECNPINRIHETQKPETLMRYLILTYSNEGETIFDGYAGSGTTGTACIKENRNFIGSEMDKQYFDKATKRIELAQSKPQLF